MPYKLVIFELSFDRLFQAREIVVHFLVFKTGNLVMAHDYVDNVH